MNIIVLLTKKNYYELHRALYDFLNKVLFSKIKPAIDESQKINLFEQLAEHWIQGLGVSTLKTAIGSNISTSTIGTLGITGNITCQESVNVTTSPEGKLDINFAIYNLSLNCGLGDKNEDSIKIPTHPLSARATFIPGFGIKLTTMNKPESLVQDLLLKKRSLKKLLFNLKQKDGISTRQKQKITQLENEITQKEALLEVLHDISVDLMHAILSEKYNNKEAVDRYTASFTGIKEKLENHIDGRPVLSLQAFNSACDNLQKIKQAKDDSLRSIVDNKLLATVDPEIQDEIQDKAVQLYIDEQVLPDIQKNRDRYLGDVKTEFAKIGLDIDLQDETNQTTLRNFAKGIYENTYGEEENKGKYFPSSKESLTDTCKDALIKFHTFDSMVTTLADKDIRPPMRLELLEDQTKTFLSPNSKIRSGSVVWQFIKDLARRLHLFQSAGEKVTQTTANKVSNKIRFFEELSKDRPRLGRTESAPNVLPADQRIDTSNKAIEEIKEARRRSL